MIKKLMLMITMLFAPICAQEIDEQDIDAAFQELIYEMGMSLADQETIVDFDSATLALTAVCDEVDEVAQIVNLFMMIDDEMVANDIVTVEDLVNYEIANNLELAQACMNWLAAYQNLFTIFIGIHGDDSDFIAWSKDADFIASWQDGQYIDDPNYELLSQASYAVMQTQLVLEDALNNATDQNDQVDFIE